MHNPLSIGSGKLSSFFTIDTESKFGSKRILCFTPEFGSHVTASPSWGDGNRTHSTRLPGKKLSDYYASPSSIPTRGHASFLSSTHIFSNPFPPNRPSGRHGATDRKWGWSPSNPALFGASCVDNLGCRSPPGSAGPGGVSRGSCRSWVHWPGADRQGHTGAGWSWAVITGEGRRGGEPGHPDPSTAPHGPAHATSGRTWLAASPAAALRRRHPGSGSDPSWARPPSRTSPAAAAPPKPPPIGSWRVRFRGERSPGRPSNRAPLRPSAQLPCKAAELASQGESQSRDSLSNPSPSSECGFLPGRGGKGAFPWSGWTRSPWGGGARRHPPASGSPERWRGPPESGVGSLSPRICFLYGARSVAITEVPASSPHPGS